jgi:hypothetical protein
MTLNEEKVVWMLRECAKKAGYQTRMAAEGVVGVIGPAKVCKLLGLIHAEVVDELVRTSAHISGLNAEIDLLRSKCLPCGCAGKGKQVVALPFGESAEMPRRSWLGWSEGNAEMSDEKTGCTLRGVCGGHGESTAPRSEPGDDVKLWSAESTESAIRESNGMDDLPVVVNGETMTLREAVERRIVSELEPTCVGPWRQCPHCGEDFCEADNPCLTAALSALTTARIDGAKEALNKVQQWCVKRHGFGSVYEFCRDLRSDTRWLASEIKEG